MLFAAGFILFFYLDIFVSLHFVAIGMMPMAYLIAAVALFVSIILIRANRNLFDLPERRLNRVWIFFLIVFAVVQFILNLRLDFVGILRMNLGMLSRITDTVICGLSSILLVFTLVDRHKTVFHRWQIFCAFSIVIQSILPVTIWRLMPVKVYMFYGLIQMPMIFGFLMMIESVLKKRFGYGARDGLRNE